ncbi:MFS transporter [Streptacidiphilus sp. P02-A3a]|uniref:MFS transporter n=1 Tax=Streptacidiphilus sp. P02-A3a TaxID=2704468 RepID=UPI0015FBE122
MSTETGDRRGRTAPRADEISATARGPRRFPMDTTPLRLPAFRRLWAATAVTTVGSQMTAVAVPLQVYDDTHSSAMVGVCAAAGLRSLPVLLVLSAVRQAFFGIGEPSHAASVARLVPEGQLSAASALVSAVDQFGQLAGPLLAGALVVVAAIAALAVAVPAFARHTPERGVGWRSAGESGVMGR